MFIKIDDIPLGDLPDGWVTKSLEDFTQDSVSFARLNKGLCMNNKPIWGYIFLASILFWISVAIIFFYA